MVAVRHGLIAALDIGTTKTVCMIAQSLGRSNNRSDIDHPLSQVKILGVGETETKGIRKGTIYDMHQAEIGIRAALDKAEENIATPVKQVIINVSAGNPESHLHRSSIHVGSVVDEGHIQTLYDRSVREFDHKGRYTIHAIPTDFTVDGASGVLNPREMRADALAMDVLFITAELPPLRNLGTCVEKCHIQLEGRILTPYASALSVLVPDEKLSGTVCIDMGGETTSIAVFNNSRLIHADVIPLGGCHITRDIAQVLSTPLSAAEKLKQTKGSAIRWMSDEKELIEIPVLGDGDDEIPNFEKIPRSHLTEVIRPRLEEIFENVQQRLQRSGVACAMNSRIVLTGGASQMTGVSDVVSSMLGRKPRLASPPHVQGLPDHYSKPAYATCLGLVCAAFNPLEELTVHTLRHTKPVKPKGKISKMVQWLRNNF
jgi:cell division protein FtsA